jgi:hypothetical protein
MKIIHDVLPQDHKAKVLETLLGLNFPWYWNENATSETQDDDAIFQLTHNFFDYNGVHSEHFIPLIVPMFEYINQLADFKIKKIVRVKANLLPRQICNDEDIKKTIHVDIPDERAFISIVYYLHDVDGDINTYDKDYNIVDSFTPKENSLVYFDSRTLHGTRPPIESKRRVCINFIVNPND